MSRYSRFLLWIARHWLGESEDKIRTVADAIHQPLPGGRS